jgi:pimeloyl-ACP methyl ester carboxylesterase
MIPGMACDERVFEPQRAGGLSFEVVRLPLPGAREPLGDYARRIRGQLELDGPCIVGGVSFGGMIAWELAHLAPVERVVLVASCLQPRAIPLRYHVAERVSRLFPDSFFQRRLDAKNQAARTVVTSHERVTEEQRRVLFEMARDCGVAMIRRVARMIVTWKPTAGRPCPVHAIHGDRDSVIPLRGVRAEEVIRGGGHLINLTHPREVNAFLARCFQMEGGPSEPRP